VKAIANTFPTRGGRKYSIKTGAALRAFVRVVPDVMARAKEMRRDRSRPTPSGGVKPWAERLRDRRFETEASGS